MWGRLQAVARGWLGSVGHQGNPRGALRKRARVEYIRGEETGDGWTRVCVCVCASWGSSGSALDHFFREAFSERAVFNY